MSNLIGSGINSNTYNHPSKQMGYGMIIPQTCKICGERKISSKPHPKCSRELQRMSRAGLL